MPETPNLPVQLTPTFRVVPAAGHDHESDSVRAIVESLSGWGFAVPEDVIQSALVVRDPDEVAAGLSDAGARRLRSHAAPVESLLDSALPALPDPVEARYMSVTSGASGFKPGTVGYVRVTQTARVEYVFEHLVVNLEKATVDIVGLQALPPTARPPVSRRALAPVPPSAVAIGTFQVIGTLLWALPPPWSAVSAAAATLVEMLIPRPEPTFTLVDATIVLEQYIDQQELGSWASQIKGFSEYIVSQQSVMAAWGTKPNTGYIRDVLLPKLRQMTTPGGNSVYDGIEHLENFCNSHLNRPPKDLQQPVELLCMGVSLQLLGLKMILQLEAVLAGEADEDGDDEAAAAGTRTWLDDYVNFQQAVSGTPDHSIDGWADRITALIAAIVAKRLEHINDPYQYQGQPPMMPYGQSNWSEYRGWTFIDSAVSSDPKTHFERGPFGKPAHCLEDPPLLPNPNVQQAHDAYYQSIRDSVEADYAPSNNVTAKWRASIADWNQKLPPPPPQAAPRPSTPSPSVASTPQGSGWVDGAHVQYAAAFVNSASMTQPRPTGTRQPMGPSEMGPPSQWLPIAASAYANLADIPVEEHQMATNVRIYRRFRTISGSNTEWRIIAILPAGQRTYADRDSKHV